MNNAVIDDSHATLPDAEIQHEESGLELNIQALGSEALKRIVSEVAEERRTGGLFSNYDRVHNRHNR